MGTRTRRFSRLLLPLLVVGTTGASLTPTALAGPDPAPRRPQVHGAATGASLRTAATTSTWSAVAVALAPNPAAPPPPTIPDAVLASATPPGTAAAMPAATSDTPDAIGAAALSTIHYPYQRLGYQIEFLGPRDGYLGMTYCSSHLVQLYVHPGEQVGVVAFITAFELAHAVDCTYNTSSTRAAWASVRGFSPANPWFPPCSCSEDNYGSGDFADVFATWLEGPGWWQWRSNLGPPPTPEQIARLLPELEPAALSG